MTKKKKEEVVEQPVVAAPPKQEPPKVKKPQWEIKDRRYFLQGNKSPLTFTNSEPATTS